MLNRSHIDLSSVILKLFHLTSFTVSVTSKSHPLSQHFHKINPRSGAVPIQYQLQLAQAVVEIGMEQGRESENVQRLYQVHLGLGPIPHGLVPILVGPVIVLVKLVIVPVKPVGNREKHRQSTSWRIEGLDQVKPVFLV